MTPPYDEHLPWSELAAAHVLDALDEPDARAFADHLAGCLRCQDMVADFRDVTGSLAEAAGPAQPPPELRARIVAAAKGPVVPSRQPRWHTVAAAAAAVAILALGGVVAADRFTGAPPPTAVTCAHSVGCQSVSLRRTDGQAVGTAMIQHGHVLLVVRGLRPNNPRNQTYVLWQVPTGGRPEAVSAFDIGHSGTTVVDAGRLVTAYSKTKAFAISREHGRTAPRAPSTPLAEGTA